MSDSKPPKKRSAPRKSARPRKTASSPAESERRERPLQVPGKRRPARAGSGGKRLLPRGLAWTLALFGLVAGAAAVALFALYPSRKGPGPGREVELSVPGDESAEALAARLEAAGLIANAHLFALYLRATGGPGAVVRGPHLVTDDLSPSELLRRLERSAFAGHARITIPEGWTRFDIARRLQLNQVTTLRAFLDATTNRALLDELALQGESAEGFLFPATYDFPKDSAAADIVRRMKLEFDKRYGALEQRNQPGLLDLTQSLGWTTREIVTLASMVEKEAVQNDERPIIASVFLNRLRDPAFKPKLLQCDPTAGYGCLMAPTVSPTCASYTGKITHDIVADAANPYNTYKHEGLPPGPIANPGARSLEAALSPATTRFLYFVARGEGRHTFSETYASHASAIHAPPPPPSAAAAPH